MTAPAVLLPDGLTAGQIFNFMIDMTCRQEAITDGDVAIDSLRKVADWLDVVPELADLPDQARRDVVGILAVLTLGTRGSIVEHLLDRALMVKRGRLPLPSITAPDVKPDEVVHALRVIAVGLEGAR